jgi:hypothetical protein
MIVSQESHSSMALCGPATSLNLREVRGAPSYLAEDVDHDQHTD